MESHASFLEFSTEGWDDVVMKCISHECRSCVFCIYMTHVRKSVNLRRRSLWQQLFMFNDQVVVKCTTLSVSASLSSSSASLSELDSAPSIRYLKNTKRTEHGERWWRREWDSRKIKRGLSMTRAESMKNGSAEACVCEDRSSLLIFKGSVCFNYSWQM